MIEPAELLDPAIPPNESPPVFWSSTSKINISATITAHITIMTIVISENVQ